jgi:branched-chain amino acid transport system substrate-binding protein
MVDYQEKYGSAPTFWGAAAADAVRLVDEAVRATSSTTGQELASYLHDRLKDFPGISGQIRNFDSAGDRAGTGNVVFELTPAGQLVVSAKQP